MKIKMKNNIINKITKNIKIDKISIPYLRIVHAYLIKLHIYLIKRSRLYYRLHKNKYIVKSKKHKNKLSLVFALTIIFAVIISPFGDVNAASYTKTWTTQSDFTTNITNINANITSLPGSVKLATNPSPAISFNSNMPNYSVGYLNSLALDSSGNIYVTDKSNNCIQVYNNAGILLRKIGSIGTADGQFSSPEGIKLDSAGNIYVVDSGNSRIQVFNNAGTFLRKFGSSGGADGQFSSPYGIALDSVGNIYVTDNSDNRIQVFNNAGIFLRKFGSTGTADGQLKAPRDVSLDSAGNIYVLEFGNARIQVFNNAGTFLRKFGGRPISTINSAPTAGGTGYIVGDVLTVTGGVSGTATVTVTTVSGGVVTGLSLTTDGNGSVYTTGTGKITTGGTGTGCTINITAIVGTSVDGQLNSPKGISLDSSGNIYTSESSNSRIQVFNNAGTFLRKFGSYGSADGQFKENSGVTVDSSGNIYVSDTNNYRLQVFNNDGAYLRKSSSYGTADGQFLSPYDITRDSSNNIYVTDANNSRIQVFNNTGTFLRKFGGKPISTINSVPTVGGTGYTVGDVLTVTGGVGGTATVTVTTVSGGVVTGLSLTTNGNGSVYATGTGKATTGGTGVGCTINITAIVSSSADGQFNSPAGIALDPSGNIYVADKINSRIQVFNNAGTYLRKFGSYGTADGQFGANFEGYIDVDSSGNIYVSDTGNSSIKVFNNVGIFLRKFGSVGYADGQFQHVTGIAIDPSGNIYVVDCYNYRIQVFDNNGNFLRKFGGKPISTINSAPTVGGTGYTVGDVLTVTGGVGGAATVTVTTVSGGVVTGLSLTTNGNGSVYTTGTGKVTTGGTGTGCTINITAIVGNYNDGMMYSPYDLTLDPSGNIYVVDTSNNRVQVFNNAGTYLRKFGFNGVADGQFYQPLGIVLDSLGKIFVTNSSSSRVTVFNNYSTYYNLATLSGTGFQTNAGGTAIWTNISWHASDVPAGTSVKFNLRTSNDGSTWSVWGPDITGVTGANSVNISEVDSQYLDIMVTLTGGGANPTLDDFTLSYTVNGPPVVSNPTASRPIQGRMGLVNFGYTVSDPDNDNATIYAFYGTGITQTGTFSSSDTTLNVDNTNNTPDSGTISLDDEMITYTGKTATSFTGLTRADLNTKAVSHTASTAVFTKCVTTTGTGLQSSGSGGSNHSGTWNAPVDLPDVNLTNVTMKVFANDEQLARMIGSAVSTGFDLDTRDITPIVNNVSVNQPSDGTINPISVAYTASDVDDTTADISFFYNPDSYVQTGTFSDTATTLNVSGTAGMPSSGVLLINNEMITYTGKTDTSFTGLTRGSLNTVAVLHSAGTSVSAKCITMTADGLQNSGTGNTYIGEWDVETDLPNSYFSGAVMTVVANDGQPTRNVGQSTSSSFIIDTKLPTLGTTPIRFNAGARTNSLSNSLTFDVSDSSPLAMMISQNSNFDQATWVDYYPSYVISLNSGDDGDRTVYSKFKDSYGNTTSVESAKITLDTTSTKPTPTFLIDASVVEQSDYQLVLSWLPISDNDFSQYSIERSIDNIFLFSQVATFNNQQTNAYADRMLSPGGTYYYRLRSQDNLGNMSNYSDILSMKPAGVDQTPPSITGPDPSVNPSATGATVSWLTNEDSNSFVEYGPTTAYGSTQGKTDSVSSHEVSLIGLDPKTDYHFRVRSRDTAGNEIVSNDFTFKTITGVDIIPPIITGPNPSSDPNATGATISWLTNEASDSFVEYGTTTDYGSTQGKIDVVSSHAVDLVGLLPETDYHFRVMSRDAAGNNVIGDGFTFKTTAIDEKTTTPAISGATAQKEGADPEEVTIIWTTDKATTSQVKYGTDTNNLDKLTIEDKALNTTHYVHISKLKPNTKYFYQVVSTDKYGNNKVDETKYFITSQTGLGSPKISAVETTDVTLNSAIISWETTVVASSVIEYGSDSSYGSKIEDQSIGSTTKHLIRLKDLKEGVKYHYRVQGLSTTGVQVSSDDYVFTVLTKPTLSNIQIKDISSTKAIVAWKTDTESDSFVDFGIDKTDSSQGRSEDVKDHAVTISNLKPATNYTVKLKSRDKYGNQSVSETRTFKTIMDTVAPVIKDLKSETSIITDSNGDSKAQAIISWSTDEPATSQVKYAAGVTTDGNYTSSTPEEPALSTSHIVIISNIKPASTYHMKIISKDASANIGTSEDYTVLTQTQEKSLFQYIIQTLEKKFEWVNGFKIF